MTNSLLIVAGLIEFVFRLVALVILVVSIFGLLILIEEGDINAFMSPVCWDLLAQNLEAKS